jgi:hypothetical protein
VLELITPSQYRHGVLNLTCAEAKHCAPNILIGTCSAFRKCRMCSRTAAPVCGEPVTWYIEMQHSASMVLHAMVRLKCDGSELDLEAYMSVAQNLSLKFSFFFIYIFYIHIAQRRYRICFMCSLNIGWPEVLWTLEDDLGSTTINPRMVLCLFGLFRWWNSSR